MATYCIGDLHGCRDEFLKLLDLIKFDSASDELILTGDLIGRGPHPVETLKEIFRLGKCVKSVLGNHDLNFLAVYYNIRKAKAKDNIEVLLKSSLCDEAVDFFLKNPLLFMHERKMLAVTHAGIYPLWSLKRALKEAKELSRVLKDPVHRKVFLQNMYGPEPRIWNKELQGMARWRFAANAFTCMRLCFPSGALDFAHSAVSPETAAAEGLIPWFDMARPMIFQDRQYTLAFGHWAALNARCDAPNIRALDTGCIWGDRLCAWRFDDDRFFYVKSPGYAGI